MLLYIVYKKFDKILFCGEDLIFFKEIGYFFGVEIFFYCYVMRLKVKDDNDI